MLNDDTLTTVGWRISRLEKRTLYWGENNSEWCMVCAESTFVFFKWWQEMQSRPELRNRDLVETSRSKLHQNTQDRDSRHENPWIMPNFF